MTDRPFRVSRDGAGDLTHAQTLASRYRITSRGVRVTEAALVADDVRWLAAQLPLRAESVLSHWSAVGIHGLPLPAGLLMVRQVHVTTPRNVPRPRSRDIVTHHAYLPAGDVCQVGDFRVTTALRTYVDMASLLRFDDLVAIGDRALAMTGATVDELLAVASTRQRYPGRGRALQALGWLDPGAASPRESHLRVLLRRAQLPLPEVNGLITDAEGGFLAVGDLVFRRQRVIVEYDGAVHAALEQRAKDAARRAVLREHGWIVVEIVGEDMRYPARVVSRVRNALHQGASR